ncbi:MAG: D-alanyl-D-alanine carboxypeptidase, partial [Clostridia bacterium]|nr:D-alanyl-D-alanine carboxypeptidase [Clostridia bacterium]
DGGKTGFTNEAKSCLSAMAKRSDTRLICVAIGAENAKTRNKEVSELLNYGFANYERKVFAKGGEKIDQTIPVANGKKSSVGGYLSCDLVSFGKKGDHKNLVVKYEFNNICAPVNANEKIGKAILCNGEKEIFSADILSSEDILEKNYGDFLDDIVEKW